MMRRIIRRIQKNDAEEIRITVFGYRGSEAIDIRVFFKVGADEFLPSRKGLIISRSLLKEVLKALVEV